MRHHDKYRAAAAPERIDGGLRGILLALIVMVVGMLSWALSALPDGETGLRDAVTEQMSRSGVSHPVTAVLLNFRAYDTVLEIGVLLLVLITVWSLGPAANTGPSRPMSSLLGESNRVLVPVIVIVAGYLLWIGAKAPGGAFHAGALLAGAGLLRLLDGWRPRRSHHGLLRAGLALGLLTCVAVATVTLAVGGSLLQYPSGWASALILTIEVAASISIGATLASLTLSGEPVAPGEDPP